MSERLDRIRTALDAAEIDALLIGSAHNRRYASGFTGSNGWLLISRDYAGLATDFRYVEQAAAEAPEFEVFHFQDRLAAWWKDFAKPIGRCKLGFEADELSVAAHKSLRDANAKLTASRRPSLVQTSGVIERVRAAKDERELDCLRRAAQLTDAAFAHARERIQPDWSERRTAWEIEQYARTHGAEALAFETIVASGPWGARPHARPRETAVGESAPIIIDMGVRIDGYCADMTRTFVIGDADNRFAEIYDIVLAAHDAAAQLVEPGMTAKDAHAIAFNVIEGAGYGERFGHGLGHGVGLQIHESPHIGKTSEDVLVENSVITIEPGIYLPEWGGVRIEDMGALTADGFESFSSTPKLRMA